MRRAGFVLPTDLTVYHEEAKTILSDLSYNIKFVMVEQTTKRALCYAPPKGTPTTTKGGQQMNLRELALRLAAITVVADAAKEAKDRLRDEFATQLNAVGADAAKAALEGTEVAKVSLVSPKASAQVVHETAFVNFVESMRPDEIVKSVRDSYKKTFLENVIENNGEAIYTPTGEVLSFITFKPREPYVSTRFATGGRDVIASAFRTGAINPAELLADDQLEIEASE